MSMLFGSQASASFSESSAHDRTSVVFAAEFFSGRVGFVSFFLFSHQLEISSKVDRDICLKIKQS